MAINQERNQTFVEILFPGTLFPEEQVQEVLSRKPQTVAKKLPKGAFCFQFFDQICKEVIVDGETRTICGKRKNESGRYYPEGKVYTAKEIAALGPDYRILLSNMECNDWPKVVKTRCGNWQPFTEKDAII